jgi:hypothetical protein
MINSDLHPSTTKSPIQEEQDLCNDALLSGNYDAISEGEWMLLCEKAHNKGKKQAKLRRPLRT